ncbi:MAG: hypothetical protein H7Y08_11880 [Rhizobiaceae bacterium]|nr:hypothetical protein [Rhizobiaceae bacterium]
MYPFTDGAKSFGDAIFRRLLAIVIFLVSAGGILYLSAVLMAKKDVSFEGAKDIFNVVVPLFGTWVGTLLAFYFARENFEIANQNVRELVAQVHPEQKGPQTQVRQMMKPRSVIKSIALKSSESEANVKLEEILKLTESGSTRVPIFDAAGIVKCMIHANTIHNFEKSILPNKLERAMLLSDFMKQAINGNPIEALVTAMAFVRTDADMADALAAMTKVPGCQDVFVTANGKANEAVLGWLTNTDITQALNIR